ncbi:MAG TPA: tripartite tricarboxylate transporter substrate-binding protein [Xanthobacteraceae bacterium]|jgi:tripartite-type tricarboxylate transporter receptor subunit TctC
MRKLGVATVCAAALCAGALCAGASAAADATAQTYPARPITMIVPFAAGGPNDSIGRIVAERMRVPLGQPVIIENVVGANGTIGVGRAARAAPDGYTLSIGGFNSHVVNGVVYALTYDVLRDFEPVALLASSGGGLIVARKTMPADDLKGLIAWLKANPDTASAGIPGIGSSVQLSGILFQNMTGTHFAHVPYRGGSPAMQDLVAGQIDMMIAADVTTSVPQVRAGTIKAYAVAARKRLAIAPDVPTTDEAGLPGFYSAPWCAFWVPSGTPKPVVAKLNAAVVDALADAGVRARLAELGQETFPSDLETPVALGAFHKAEIEKWWPIIKAAGIKGE